MSVKVCDRKQGRFETLTISMELSSHTIKVCDNSNIFPKRHRLSITADIIKETKWLPKNISKNRRKLKKMVIIKSVNRLECDKVLQAILAHIRKSNNRSQVNKLIKYYNELWKEKDYVESKIIRGKSCRFRETC